MGSVNVNQSDVDEIHVHHVDYVQMVVCWVILNRNDVVDNSNLVDGFVNVHAIEKKLE